MTVLMTARLIIELTQLQEADASTLETGISKAGELADELEAGARRRARHLLHQILERIEVRPGELELQISRPALRSLLLGDNARQVPDCAHEIAILALPFQMRRSGVEARLILNGAVDSAGKSDPNLVQLVRDAHRWMAVLAGGQVTSIDELAMQEDMRANEISRILPIAFLAPDITRAILLGTHPVELNSERLKRNGKLPACWQEQRRVLGLTG
jgi:hypothetical protein